MDNWKYRKENFQLLILHFQLRIGGLAQLARAPALHAGGHRFDSDILHQFSKKKITVNVLL